MKQTVCSTNMMINDPDRANCGSKNQIQVFSYLKRYVHTEQALDVSLFIATLERGIVFPSAKLEPKQYLST